jgi:hypothetical protein
MSPPVDPPVKLGSMLFTLVDPHRGHEVAYNRWYERDHYYAGCMIGPWLMAGSRWVAPRALKRLRLPPDSPFTRPVDAGSYLAIYWIQAGHHDDHFKWSGEQVHRLYSEGRGFSERSHVHTALYDHRSSVYRDGDPVPVELALDHRYPGLVVSVLERDAGAREEALDAWLEGEALPKLLAGSGVASTAIFAPRPTEGSPTQNAPMDLGSAPGGPERRLLLCFLEADPVSEWERFRAFADTVSGSGLARSLFLGPFLPTVVGTDTYARDLW